jgi:5-methylcytosine-specific restriction endonuclease McrA
MKKCTVCDKFYVYIDDNFSKLSRSKDGYRSYCKTCQSEYNKKRLEKIRDTKKDTPESKTCARCNVEKLACQFYKTKYSISGLYFICKECDDVRTRNRRGAQAENNMTKQDYQDILDADNNCCHYCATPVRKGNLNWDHKIPISKGGTNTKQNIVASCSTCNKKKNVKSYEDFVYLLDIG